MKIGIAHADTEEAFAGGSHIAREAVAKGGIQRPDLVLAFCGGLVDHDGFFNGMQSVLGPRVPIVGGSAIGVLTNDFLSYRGCPAAAAVIQSDSLHSRIAVTGRLDAGEREVGKELVRLLHLDDRDRLMFLLYDSIRKPAADGRPPELNASAPLIDGIEEETSVDVPLVGAGLVGDYAMGATRQFCGSRVETQKAVGVAFRGNIIPYCRIMHGCTPLDGIYRKITSIESSVIYELDGRPIVDTIDSLYGNSDWRSRIPVNLLTIGKNCGERFGPFEESHYINRLITGVLPGGEGITIFEPDYEEGTEIQFMIRDHEAMLSSARANSEELMQRISTDGRKALFGIYIDCAGRTASYLNIDVEEASIVQEVFNRHGVPLLGFYSGVEIAPLLGKSRGLDWTGVLLVFSGDR